MIKRVLTLSAMFALCALPLAGCYSPGGGMFSSMGGPQTFRSTESLQKTVTLIDLRSGETVFSIDVPPGKQLTFDFSRGEGDDPVYTPDLMRYEIQDAGTSFGKLSNAMTVPNAASRRVEVSVRQTVEYAATPEQRALRTDEMRDRPAWWTPKGGPLPEDTTLGMYDN